jgi:hypothetical protein
VSRLVVWLLPGIGLALFYLWAAVRTSGTLGFPLDDAWIHAQFARNLATGHGFTYTGGRWVAGSTAPGWTLLLALGYLGLRSVIVSALVLGIALQVMAGVFAARMTELLTEDRTLSVIAGVAVMVTPVMTWGAVSGMEVALSGALVLAGYYQYLSGRASDGPARWTGVAMLALSCLARPENLVLLAIVSGDLVWRAGGGLRAVRSAALIVGISAGILGPFVAFDFATTGKPLPTTFYAKSGQGLLRSLSEGNTENAVGAVVEHGPTAVRKFAETLVDQLSFASPLVFVGMLVSLARPGRQRGAWLLAASILVAPFAMGAIAPQRLKPDNVRYTGQLVCLATVLVFMGMREAARWIRRPALLTAAAAVLLAVIAWRSAAGASVYAVSVKNIQQLHVETADWIRTHLPADCTVGVNDVGALAYFGGHTLIDIEGLVTPEALEFRGPARGLRFVDAVHPDYLVIFPHWYPEIARDTARFVEVHRVSIPDNVVTAGDKLIVYRTPWARKPVIQNPEPEPKRSRWPS